MSSESYIIAFYLSPPYRFIATSKKYTAKDIHKLIIYKARNIFTSLSEDEARSILDSLKDYHKGIGVYANRKRDVAKYWRTMPTKLGEFANYILSLVPTSARVEGLFSSLSRTKTNMRNRMSVETLTAAGKIKLDALN